MDLLSELALKHGTDKGTNPGWHCYTPHYDELFGPVRNEINTLLEIGVYQGASLNMWRDYFPNAQIVGLDYANEVTENYLQSLNDLEGRTNVFVGDQGNSDDLQCLVDWFDDFDIIIDDGSHDPKDYLYSLSYLWPDVRKWYVIEDIQPEFTETTMYAVKNLRPSSWTRIPSQAGNKDRYALVLSK